MVLGQATLGSLRPRGDNLSSLFPSNTLVLHIRKRSPSSSPSLHLSLGKYSCTTNLFPSRLLREGEVVFQRLSHLLSQYAFPAATWLTSWTCYHSRERGRDTSNPAKNTFHLGVFWQHYRRTLANGSRRRDGEHWQLFSIVYFDFTDLEVSKAPF